MHEIFAFIESMSPLNLSFTIIGLLIVWMMWRAQKSDNHAYDIRDILMDTSTGKASLYAHVIAGMAILTGYYVLATDSDSHDNFLVYALGVFVLGRGLAQGINAWKLPDPPMPGKKTTTLIEEQQPSAIDESQAATLPRGGGRK